MCANPRPGEAGFARYAAPRSHPLYACLSTTICGRAGFARLCILTRQGIGNPSRGSHSWLFAFTHKLTSRCLWRDFRKCSILNRLATHPGVRYCDPNGRYTAKPMPASVLCLADIETPKTTARVMLPGKFGGHRVLAKKAKFTNDSKLGARR